MSVIQVEDLVSYQLRTSYLNDIADGVGERLLTVNETLVNTAPFKAAGWRPTSSHKRTHSPPIPTAIASEYFQAPRQLGFSLEDGEDDGGMLTHGGADTVGPGIATKRRRRREQMEEDDSSDLSDESEEEQEQRDAQRIKFAKMPLRHRAGSSPLQNTALRNRAGSSPLQNTTLRQPFGSTSPRAVRRGSQSALETVKERARRDTVTSSEISSESEFDLPQRHREAARAAARTLKLQDKINEEPTPGLNRADTTLLPEEEEDSDEGSDISEDYVGSIDSASILNAVETGSPTEPVVGTPPREFRRQSKRISQLPSEPAKLSALPPPRPLSTIRPLSIVKPTSLLTQALKAKDTKPSIPFQKFAHYNGQGTTGSIAVRIYPAYGKTASRPFEVPIRPRVSDGQGAERAVTVADLIGLSLYRYNEEKREPRLPRDKLNINWWTLRMVEDGGEVDDDFPPFERTKPLVSFTTVHNAGLRGGGRMRSNSRAFDDFALVLADEDEYEANKKLTPQEDEQVAPQPVPVSDAKEARKELPQPGAATAQPGIGHPRQNPIVTTTYRSNTPFADAPQNRNVMPNTNRGQQKLLRVHIMSSDTVPGQMVTVDVTTDTYLEEVLDLVCRKRQLDKANHVLKLPGSGVVAMVDRPVSSIGNVSDLELYRRRFGTDGPLAMAGSPSGASPRLGAATSLPESHLLRRANKQQRGAAGGGAPMMGVHPLAREALKQEELGTEGYKKYTVWRKQPMRLVLSERLLMIDGEYIHIVPASGGKALRDSTSKTTTVHFSNVIGCKVARKHPTNIKLVVYKAAETKRYDFEARNAEEAAEIVNELKRGIAPYNRE
ncbi:stress activated MAP kinase interacting protein Sin1 [Cordyceps fumosorosea ARSEF 2679]|uniref:Stress activated MAP kinase interacting protein Sin1 n=1 Tax=Cordyceps fumosorosea (strain ARSEF 2679) TaxID=1081104 RepID=A0A162JNA2_CORFA|nr:stress activated MAP kinase interacting protein Sin1 [Cordyceps fumosorosea ARSEF 2679]OAA71392.1 stress activated MAP kinase interacting protein Sin1 [Cordyceps fumosorosea ARSEF 2679]